MASTDPEIFLTPPRIVQVLSDAGASMVRVEPTGLGWVLAAYYRRA